MGLSTDDLATAFRALSSKACTERDLQKALRAHSGLMDKGTRRTLVQVLGDSGITAGDAAVNPAADPDTMERLGTIVLDSELASENDLDRFIDAFSVHQDPRTLPAVPVPSGLAGYDVDWEMARTANGAVFRAMKDRKPITLKIYRADAFPDDAARTTFVERARKSPTDAGFVPVVEAGVAGGQAWVANEYVEGPSMASLLADRKMSLRRGFEAIERTGRILAPRHAKGEGHGRLSGTAIALTSDDKPHVFGFGWDEGTPAEDIFALGRLLYEIAAGATPFSGFRPTELKPPSRFNASAAGAAEKIIVKALARDPKRRYADGGALADDIARFLKHEAVLADVDIKEAAPAKVRRSSGAKWPKVVGAIAAVLVLATVGYALTRRTSTDPKGPAAPEVRQPSPRAPIAPVPPKFPKPPPSRVDPKREELMQKGPMNRTLLMNTRFEGVAALADRDFAKLDELAEIVLVRGPEQDWAHHWKAIAASERADTTLALTHVRRAIEMGMDSRDVLDLRHHLLMTRAEFRKVLEHLDAMFPGGVSQETSEIGRLKEEIHKSANDPRLYLQRGMLYHRRKLYSYAVQDFERAAKLGDYRSHYFRALSLIEDDRRREAIDAINAFLSTQGALPGAEEAKLVLAELTEK